MQTLVKAEIWTIARTEQGNAVLIRPLGAEVAVPIFVGQFETQAILIGFGDVQMPRPLTHDLMLNLLKDLGISLLRVEITDLKEGTFFSNLILDRNGEELILDSRPSDALALAVRNKCPVFISEFIVETSGVSVNLIMENAIATSETPGDRKDPQGRRESLETDLRTAVEREDYERAAEIRDLLKALEGSGDAPPLK